MPEHHIYYHFDEIIEELKSSAPEIVYKYRTWSDPNHQNLLKKRSLWFSHPFDLNDVQDVRPELSFDFREIEDPEFLKKLIKSANMGSERENRVRGENQLDLFKSDNTLLIKNAEAFNSDRHNFDSVGIFSAAKTSVNKNLWNGYSNNFTGYCIGFKTLALCREVKSGFGHVKYSDAPLKFRFIKAEKDDPSMFYYKKRSWAIEEEFRFASTAIQNDSNRVQVVSKKCVAEVLLGEYCSKDDRQEIVETVRRIYGLRIPTSIAYTTKRGLVKTRPL